MYLFYFYYSDHNKHLQACQLDAGYHLAKAEYYRLIGCGHILQTVSLLFQTCGSAGVGPFNRQCRIFVEAQNCLDQIGHLSADTAPTSVCWPSSHREVHA